MHRDSYYNVINNTHNRKYILEDKSSNSSPFSFLSLHNDDSLWKHYFGENVSYNPYTGKQESKISESWNIYVFLATFIDIDKNGCIRVENEFDATNKVLIAESFFSDSYDEWWGGSIYVKGGSSIQYRICSINSRIAKDHGAGCHSYVQTYGKSYVIESSLTKSNGNYACIRLEGGSQLIDSTNISYAKCTHYAAYICSNPSSHQIKFTTIFNNTAFDCIMDHYRSNYLVSRCNVIKNEISKGYLDFVHGIVFCHSDLLEISFCVFSSNFAPSLFYNFDGTFVVNQCFYDNKDVDKTANHLISSSTNWWGEIEYSSASPVRYNLTNKFGLNLHHLSTQECEAELPLKNIKNVHREGTQYSHFISFLFSFFIFYVKK